jgi:phospholipase/carboxylesterase
MTMLDGPRLPARSGRTRSLVVLLHGYGADGNDLIDLGRHWQAALPDTAFVAPNAPEPCAGAPFGRQWFPLTFRDMGERWRGVQHALPALDKFLDGEIERSGLAAGSVALVGFSQGAMMALHAGLRLREAPAAILALSGLLVAPPGEPPSVMKGDVVARPPVFLVHGDQDEVIPPEALYFSSQGLASLDVPAEFHLCRGVGHAIDAEALRLGGEFLRRALA